MTITKAWIVVVSVVSFTFVFSPFFAASNHDVKHAQDNGRWEISHQVPADNRIAFKVSRVRPIILVIAAQHLFVAALSRLLSASALQARTSTAEGYDPALELLRVNPVDLVLCDVRMPRTTGFGSGRTAMGRAKRWSTRGGRAVTKTSPSSPPAGPTSMTSTSERGDACGSPASSPATTSTFLAGLSPSAIASSSGGTTAS